MLASLLQPYPLGVTVPTEATYSLAGHWDGSEKNLGVSAALLGLSPSCSTSCLYKHATYMQTLCKDSFQSEAVSHRVDGPKLLRTTASSLKKQKFQMEWKAKFRKQKETEYWLQCPLIPESYSRVGKLETSMQRRASSKFFCIWEAHTPPLLWTYRNLNAGLSSQIL